MHRSFRGPEAGAGLELKENSGAEPAAPKAGVLVPNCEEAPVEPKEKEGVELPKAEVVPPNSGEGEAELNEKAGVLEPKAGVFEPKAGVEDPKPGVADPKPGLEEPNAGVDAPKAGVLAPKGFAAEDAPKLKGAGCSNEDYQAKDFRLYIPDTVSDSHRRCLKRHVPVSS